MHSKSILTILLLMVFYSSCNSTKKTSNTEVKEISILDQEWVLTSWEKNEIIQEVKTQSPIKMNLDSTEKRMTGNDGCNNFFGGYTFDAEVLLIGNTGGTKMYCGEESSKWEQSFSKLIQSKPRFTLDKNTLILKTKTDKLTFNPQN